MSEKKQYHALMPRKPSSTFIDVFLSHDFNDELRGRNHERKGSSSSHCNPNIVETAS